MTVKLALILAAVLACFGAGFYVGHLSPALKAAKTVVRQEIAQQKKTIVDQATVAEEAKTYEAATDPLAPVAAPVVRLCYTPAFAPVPSPHPARSGTAQSPALPAAAAPAPLPGPDIGRPVVQLGIQADAQVAGLIDYVQRVCQARAP